MAGIWCPGAMYYWMPTASYYAGSKRGIWSGLCSGSMRDCGLQINSVNMIKIQLGL